MIRVTFELLPGGHEAGKRTIGLIEIANVATRLDGFADYAVVLKKTPPFAGALRAAWRKGKLTVGDQAINGALSGENEDFIVALVEGHHRIKRGVYDLLFRALKACGLEARNP
jgi:hypothetical protein